MVTSYKYHRLIMLFALVLSTTRSERISFVTYKVCANTAQYVFLNCHSCSCRLRQGGIFSVMLIRSTAHPSYCPFAILPIRHTATSDLRRVPIRPIEKCPSDQLKMPIRSLLTSGATTPQWRNLPLPTESLFITTLSTMDTGQALPKYQLLGLPVAK